MIDVYSILLAFLKPLTPFMPMAAILFGLLFFAKWINSPRFKGMIGEYAVNKFAEKLDQDVYRLVKNVTLPTSDGTTQIDHIIVSVYGIFVIETKFMKGWIFGSERQSEWTQQLFRKKIKFQNPLRQNYKHTETIRELFSLNKEQVHSVIVFVGQDVELKTTMPKNVICGRAYVDYIQSFNNRVLTEEQAAAILKGIQDERLSPSWATDRQHIAHLKSAHDTDVVREPAPSSSTPQESPLTLTNPSCPRCGGSMVQKIIKRGKRAGSQIWGCQHYPKCRGTIQCCDGLPVEE